jgi:hypothetical protein
MDFLYYMVFFQYTKHILHNYTFRKSLRDWDLKILLVQIPCFSPFFHLPNFLKRHSSGHLPRSGGRTRANRIKCVLPAISRIYPKWHEFHESFGRKSSVFIYSFIIQYSEISLDFIAGRGYFVRCRFLSVILFRLFWRFRWFRLCRWKHIRKSILYMSHGFS